MNLPDLARARQVWLTPPRLVVGGVLATALGSAAALFSVGHNPGQLLTAWVLLMQGAVLFFYGVPAAVNDFVEEHRNNTWDMLRLTPLTAAEIVVGRLTASTSYAAYLALCLAPWALFAQTLEGAPSPTRLAAQWAALALTFVGASATGVAAAALAARLQAGRVGNTGLAMGGLGAVTASWTLGMLASSDKIELVFGTVPLGLWLTALLVLWSGWSLAAAARLVDRLLSERPRPAFFPAFLASVWAFLVLWVPGGHTRYAELASAAACLSIPAVLALLSAFTEGEGAEQWRANLRLAKRRRDWTAALPGWAWPWLTVAALAAVTAALRPETSRIALMTACFLARDFLLLGALRTVMRKGVEVAGIALMGALYLLPLFYGLATGEAGAVFLFMFLPTGSQTAGFAANVLPGFLQLVLAGLLFYNGVRRAARTERGQEGLTGAPEGPGLLR
jgi:hypothetical protein